MHTTRFLFNTYPDWKKVLASIFQSLYHNPHGNKNAP